MPKSNFWQPKLRTAAAMARLCWARFLVSSVPFRRWQGSLGFTAPAGRSADLAAARRLAADIEWAAKRLPFDTKCLPRAMALSWMLSRRRMGHAVVIAVRPMQLRLSADSLHAWLEIEAHKVLGDLPGPWIETARLEG